MVRRTVGSSFIVLLLQNLFLKSAEVGYWFDRRCGDNAQINYGNIPDHVQMEFSQDFVSF